MLRTNRTWPVNRRGSALIMVLVLTVAVAALALSAVALTGHTGLVTRYYDREQEFRYASEAALAMGGAALADVVQTRMYVTDISRWDQVGRAHGEFFADVRPVTTMVEVAALIDPRMMIEVEAVAHLGRTTDD